MPRSPSPEEHHAGWATLTGVGALVVLGDELLMIRRRRPYGVHRELPSGYYAPSVGRDGTESYSVLGDAP